ncbi:MAG: TolC family protein, partial [Gammaproteobacteria bacterium]
IGAGDAAPLVAGAGAHARARNRRVEVTVSYREPASLVATPDPAFPADFEPWWQGGVMSPMLPGAAARAEDIESLYLRALQHSSQIEVFRDVPLIRETAILEAEGSFDPNLFMEAEFRDTDEPVGSTLRTGGPARFKEQQLAYTAGVRKRVASGGEVELSQRVARQQNNSVFFVPDDQALSRMQLSFTQPLLRGAGVGYNRSTVAIAKIDHSIAADELQRQVESHLLEIAQSYWSLYQERARYLIDQRLAHRSGDLLATLQGRRGIDVIEAQLATARAALAQREADLVNAAKAIRNAEARLVTLVNDPELNFAVDFELVPRLPPLPPRVTLDVAEASRQALANRPEIDQSMKQLRAGMLREQVSENEMLPELDLIAGLELNGLEGDDGFGRSFGNQFDEGDPGYFVGLRLNYAIGNRAAKARYQRRRLEVRQLGNQLRTTINTLLLETQVSVREAHATRQELLARYRAMEAAAKDVESLEARREVALTQGEQGSDYLARLLNAQEDLAAAEKAFVASRVTYSLAMVNLDRAMGILLQTNGIAAERVQPDNLPPEIELGRR